MASVAVPSAKDVAKSLEFEANRDAETPFAAREEVGKRLSQHDTVVTRIIPAELKTETSRKPEKMKMKDMENTHLGRSVAFLNSSSQNAC